MAEAQGFEPWVRCRTLVFKTSAFDRSATLPKIGSPLAGTLWTVYIRPLHCNSPAI